MKVMRDHYEGTPYDMTKGVDAGPFGSPLRHRGLTWEMETIYSWERPISTQQTAFSFISQSRDSLPDPIGGVYWYGLDDTYTSCYVPLYCCIDEVPESFTRGDIQQFSWDSAWWVFNFVANFANLRYCDMARISSRSNPSWKVSSGHAACHRKNRLRTVENRSSNGGPVSDQLLGEPRGHGRQTLDRTGRISHLHL